MNMKKVFIITVVLVSFSSYSQDVQLNRNETYQFSDIKVVLKEKLKRPDKLERFSISISGNVSTRQLEKLLASENTEVSIFNTHKLIQQSDTILVDHDYYTIFFKNEELTYIFLRSYSEDVANLLGNITFFTFLGTIENNSELNIYKIK